MNLTEALNFGAFLQKFTGRKVDQDKKIAKLDSRLSGKSYKPTVINPKNLQHVQQFSGATSADTVKKDLDFPSFLRKVAVQPTDKTTKGVAQKAGVLPTAKQNMDAGWKAKGAFERKENKEKVKSTYTKAYSATAPEDRKISSYTASFEEPPANLSEAEFFNELSKAAKSKNKG